jgi:hypothetical protein
MATPGSTPVDLDAHFTRGDLNSAVTLVAPFCINRQAASEVLVAFVEPSAPNAPRLLLASAGTAITAAATRDKNTPTKTPVLRVLFMMPLRIVVA